jgi:hypothetical protein
MSDSPVCGELRAKRAAIAEHIRDLEKQARGWRERLKALDATLKVFEGGELADSLPPRVSHFPRGRYSGLVLDYLRRAGKAVSALEIAAAMSKSRHLPGDEETRVYMVEKTLGALSWLRSRNVARRIGSGKEAVWTVAPLEDDAGLLNFARCRFTASKTARVSARAVGLVLANHTARAKHIRARLCHVHFPS